MQDVDRLSTLVSVMGGVAAHYIFHKYEPGRAISILSLILGPPIIVAFWLYPASGSSVIPLVRSYAIHLGSLIASVVAYRLSPYHPLAAFPGPVVCKVTRLWALYTVQTGNQHRYYKSLHARYGTHVRTGPDHVHISDAAGLATVMGTKPFLRSRRYSIARPPGTMGSVIGIRDPQLHAQRRKIWDRSMNTKAVLGYQDMLSARIGQLINALEKRQGSEVDLASWLSCLSFDFMGDLAFGGAFRLLEQGSDVEGYMRMARISAKFGETMGTIPWVKPFLWMLPGVGGMNRFMAFAKESVLDRKSRGSSRKDIFYYLLDEEGLGNGPPSLPTLTLESSLAIVAGSDTTGTALSNLFFYLMSSPEIYARLREEVDRAFPPGTEAFSPGVAAEMKLLNAVINETLRLQPAVPAGVQRVLPKGVGGVDVAGRWIPEGTTVQMSAYSVHRDPRYFYPDPEYFRPDRWLETTPGSKLDQSSFFPFSYGPTSCAGKGLALLELRTVVCSLIQKFDFELAPSFNSDDWERNLTDCFILVKGELPVRVTARNL